MGHHKKEIMNTSLESQKEMREKKGKKAYLKNNG